MKRSHIVSIVLEFVLGLMLILWPRATMYVGVRLISVVLILIAASGISAFLSERRWSAENVIMLLGALALLFAGGYGLFRTRFVERRLSWILGALIAVVAAYRFWLASKGTANKAEMSASALGLLFGIVIILNPFTSIRTFSILAGLALVYNAATGWLSQRGTL